MKQWAKALVFLAWMAGPGCDVASWVVYDWYIRDGTGEPNAAAGSRPLPVSQTTLDLAPGKPNYPDCTIAWYIEAIGPDGLPLPEACVAGLTVDGESWEGI